MNSGKKYIFIIILAVFLFGNIRGIEAAPTKTAFTEIDLITAEDSLIPGQSIWVAIHMKLDEHWHTYWINPGDSGLAATVKWALPKGFAAGEIHWPAPKKFDEGGMTTYGHDGEIWLLSEMTVSKDIRPGQSVTLKARVDWLVCKNMCVPASADLALELPVAEKQPVINTEIRQAFERAKSFWPAKESPWDISVTQTDGYFTIGLLPPEGEVQLLRSLMFFPQRDDVMDHAAQQMLEKKEDGYELNLHKSTIIKGGIEAISGVLVADQGWNGPGTKKALWIEEKL
jgi:DsbC/DsbD-like thiol-disulfide interchange protein